MNLLWGPRVSLLPDKAEKIKILNDDEVVLQVGRGVLKTQVGVGSKKMDAVVDTGAGISVIDQALVRGLKMKKGRTKTIRLADGSSMCVRGRVCLRIHGRLYPFMVVPRLRDGIILGMDILKKIGATIYCDSRNRWKMRFGFDRWDAKPRRPRPNWIQKQRSAFD